MDLDALINKHYGVQLSSAELLEEQLEILVDEVLEGFTGIIKEEKGPEEGGKRFSMTIPIPSLVPNEAWGRPGSQSRAAIKKVFDSITGGTDIKARIENVNTFLRPEEAARKAPGGQINAIINMMQIIEALQACLNDYNESAAGFVFEGFMAALTAGEQISGRIGGTLPIEDFVAHSTIGGEKGVPVSLKLLSPKTNIHGSFTNLIDYLFLREASPGSAPNSNIMYLVAYKNVEGDNVTKLAIYEFIISRENVVHALSQTSNNKDLWGSSKNREDIANHITTFSKSDPASWRLRMLELLKDAPGYTENRGMFYDKMGDKGEIYIKGKKARDKDKEYERKSWLKKQSPEDSSYDKMLSRSAKLNPYFKLARLAATEDVDNRVYEYPATHKTSEESFAAFAAKPEVKKYVKDNPEVRDQLEKHHKEAFKKRGRRAYDGARAAAAKKRYEDSMSESFFGEFHDREKALMAEESLLLESSSGGKQWGISNVAMINMGDDISTQFYGELDLSEANIEACAKIYIKKIGKDMMKLLEDTKNFSENIGKYFSLENRTEAASASTEAVEQGEEIVKTLKKVE